VGASPIQNIGAYGAELSDVIERIEVVHSGSLTTRSLLPSDCQFAYRDSIFKTEKGRGWLITAVDMKLSKTPTLNLSYPALEVAISSSEKSPQALLRAVIAIRKAKLPDPAAQPNVGSYFKNPIVTREKADALGARYPNLPQYSARGGAVKLSAAWMIDHLGWRGKGGHGALVAKEHALVVINKSAKYASQIIEFADEIARSVEAEFGIVLEREPQVLGSDTPV
jgi:UDP-N-acetylmuramate dehydrogenase